MLDYTIRIGSTPTTVIKHENLVRFVQECLFNAWQTGNSTSIKTVPRAPFVTKRSITETLRQCDNFVFAAFVMVQLFVLILLSYLFWKVCKIFLMTRPNHYSDTGVASENDESCMTEPEENQRREMFPQGNT